MRIVLIILGMFFGGLFLLGAFSSIGGSLPQTTSVGAITNQLSNAGIMTSSWMWIAMIIGLALVMIQPKLRKEMARFGLYGLAWIATYWSWPIGIIIGLIAIMVSFGSAIPLVGRFVRPILANPLSAWVTAPLGTVGIYLLLGHPLCSYIDVNGITLGALASVIMTGIFVLSGLGLLGKKKWSARKASKTATT